MNTKFSPRTISRRSFVGMGIASLVLTDLACSSGPDGSDGRLRARPHAVTRPAPPAGLSSLGLGSDRDALIHVPASYRPETPARLLLALHGAGRAANEMTNLAMREVADELGVIILAPSSRDISWDLVYGGFGADVEFIDRALDWVFDRLAVDPAKIAIAGFSDGGSYSISLGLTNGYLFRKVIAWSPGFYQLSSPTGKPPVFISHGVADTILPINTTSRRIVPELRAAGYEVEYREFEGPHTVPVEIGRAAFEWMAA